MPTLYSMYQGRRSEIIAEYLLSSIAFTVPVVARADIGVDLFCTLFNSCMKTNRRCLTPKFTFAIQIKSKGDPIVLSDSNIDYIRVLEVPYFIGVVDKVKQNLTIFSCQQFLQLSQKFGGLKRSEEFGIKLIPKEKYSEENMQNNLVPLLSDEHKEFENLLSDNSITLKKGKKSIKGIKLEIGPKIIQMDISRINDEKEKEESTKLMSHWIELWYENKYHEKTYVPFHKLKFYDNKETYNGWYHSKHYEQNVYGRLAIRLAMLFKHYSENENILIEHKEIVENSKYLVRLILSMREKNTLYFGELYYKKLEEEYEKVIKKIKNPSD